MSSDVCTYKNAIYVEGQQWYDDCSKVCVCEDGKTGFYRCSDRYVCCSCFFFLFFFCCCCSALFSYSTLGDQSCASRVSVTSPGARLTRQCRPVARWSSTPRTPPVARCLSAPRPQGQLASRHPYPDRVPHPSSSPTSLVLSPAAFRHLPRVQAGKRHHLTVSTLKLFTWITGFCMVRTSYCVCF